jgi:hypothetical protein
MVGNMENVQVEQLAKQIYVALARMLKELKLGAGLLAAVADVREGLPFEEAAPKTRDVFYRLAENLTQTQEKR